MQEKPLDIVPILEALSLIIANTPIEQKEFVKKFRHVLVKKLRREFPDASNGDLAEKIGMNRGTIADVLDEKDLPRVAPSNEAYILNALWLMKDENNLVDYSGENSFHSIAKKQLVGKYAPITALNSLICSGSIEFESENKLLIKSRGLFISNDKRMAVYFIGNTFLKLVETVLFNMDDKNSDKKYQNSVFSNKIPLHLVGKVHREIFDYIKLTVMVEVRRIIDSYETDSEQCYPEYSVSIFEHYQ